MHADFDVEDQKRQGDQEQKEEKADLVLDQLEIKGNSRSESVELRLCAFVEEMPPERLVEDVPPRVKRPIDIQRPRCFFNLFDLLC